MAEARDRPWIGYVGPFEFPWGRAASRRVYFVAKAIASTGVDVRVGSAAGPVGAIHEVEPAPGGGLISSVDLGEFPSSRGVSRALDWAWRMGAASVEWLDSQPTRPTHVIVYGGSLSYTRQVMRWARKNGVAVLLDLVEWFDPSAFRGGYLHPQWWAEASSRFWLHPRVDGVIAISRLLADQPLRNGVPTAIIPPGSGDTDVKRQRDPADESIEFVYAGTPGAKDDLGLVVRAIQEFAAEGYPVRLVVLGPTADEVAALSGCKPHSALEVLGRVDQSSVLAHVAHADFSVLIRPDRRSSNAGFPTKFVESLSVGTPVIANLTSDLADYLVSGETGIVVGERSLPAIKEALAQACATAPHERALMRSMAAQTSLRFHWSQTTAVVEKLLKESRQRASLRSRS